MASPWTLQALPRPQEEVRSSFFRSECRVSPCVSDVSYQFLSYCFLWYLVIVFPVMFPSFSFNNKPTGPASRDNSTGGSLRSFGSGTLGRLPKGPLEPDAASEPHSSKNYRKITVPLSCQSLDLHGSTTNSWNKLFWQSASALVRSQLWKWSDGDVWLNERLCKLCISCNCKSRSLLLPSRLLHDHLILNSCAESVSYHINIY